MNRIMTSKTLMWIGIVLVLATGLIHLIEGPDNYDETAYKGILFFLNALGALIAAIGIYRGEKLWGWSLGLLVTAGALVMYIISRTVGLPGVGVDDAWFEPMGAASLVVEGLFVLLYAYVMTRSAPGRAAAPGVSRRSEYSRDTSR
jgi:peptidoglycan/LPS O-acetylase OafA/YrhL